MSGEFSGDDTGGVAGPMPAPKHVVTPMRPIPGAITPEAHQAALERLVDAMLMTCTIRRSAGDAYRIALKIAIVAAPFGVSGAATEKVLAGLLKRLENHMATVPNEVPAGGTVGGVMGPGPFGSAT